MITPVMSMQCYIVVFDILLPIRNGDTHTFFTCATWFSLLEGFFLEGIQQHKVGFVITKVGFAQTRPGGISCRCLELMPGDRVILMNFVTL